MKKKILKGLTRRDFIILSSVTGAALATSKLDAFGESKGVLKPGETAEGKPFLAASGSAAAGAKIVLNKKADRIFVHRIAVDKLDEKGRITVDFRFEGPTAGSKPVLLTLILIDDSGSAFKTLERRCEDLRLKPSKIVQHGPKSFDAQPRQNHEEIDISLDDLSRLGSVKIEFRRIH
jgi:hypothetical protein